MGIHFAAVMTNGVLRPIEPVDLAEGQTVSCQTADGHYDSSGVPDVMDLASILAKEHLTILLHELKSPLAAARNILAMAQRESTMLPPLSHPYLDEALYYLEAAANLTSSLRLQPETPRREPLTLSRDVIAAAISQLNLTLRRRSLSPKQITFPEVTSIPRLMADRRSLTHLVITLLHRAIIDAPDDPSAFRIDIGASRTPDAFLIRFRDWGQGVASLIDPTQTDGRRAMIEVPDLFSGIGLLAAANIARSYGGSLQLSSPRNPTEFTLQLPADLATSSESAAP